MYNWRTEIDLSNLESYMDYALISPILYATSSEQSISTLCMPSSPMGTPHPWAQPDAAKLWWTAAAQGQSFPCTGRSMQTVPEGVMDLFYLKRTAGTNI